MLEALPQLLADSLDGDRPQVLGPAADQYAFCVALWQCLEGYLPYPGRDRAAMLAAITEGEPLTAARARVPERVRAVVRKGLSPAPEDRYADMSGLLHALKQARGPVLVEITEEEAGVGDTTPTENSGETDGNEGTDEAGGETPVDENDSSGGDDPA